MEFIARIIHEHADILVGSFLIGVIAIYFRTNPLGHSGWFQFRRFINWFPLGMTYAFLYMGRYNLTVSKNALGGLMTKEDLGNIFAVGTAVYAFSFLVNGPLVDKIGGKRGILIAALGTAAANIMLGVLTYLVVTGKVTKHIMTSYAVLYGLNMYFQSYGAVSIIKIKAYWFHVRERGLFGAMFGTLISIGIYFAFDWGRAIVEMTRAGASGGWIQSMLQWLFATDVRVNGQLVDATWAIFFIPGFILLGWVLLDYWLIKDEPEQAGFPAFDTHDASSGQMHIELTTMDLLKKVFTSPLMIMIAFVELTSGVIRNGIIQWYSVFSHEQSQPGAEFFRDNWGFLLCAFGIVGGFLGGFLSDRVFQSRRGPPAALLCGTMFCLFIVMWVSVFKSPVMLALAALFISMAVIGVHSLMSGTAAADFGGRKATATCSGIVDGFVYLGSSVQSYFVGQLVPGEKGSADTFMGITRDWHCWPLFLMPFALIGCFLALRIWHALPEATRRFNAEKRI
jgi:MFS transporter, OPA family, glycerol-3-phosphate transporter